MSGSKQRILILGGGFAGVYTALYLEKKMSSSERDGIEITLVSRENYMVFQPLLPEVISGTLEMMHVITPIRRLAKRTKVVTRNIQSVDLAQKIVFLDPEFKPRTMALHFDHLVIALGTRLNYDLVPGMREHAIPFKYLGDALRLRNAIVQSLEKPITNPTLSSGNGCLHSSSGAAASRAWNASPSCKTSCGAPCLLTARCGWRS